MSEEVHIVVLKMQWLLCRGLILPTLLISAKAVDELPKGKKKQLSEHLVTIVVSLADQFSICGSYGILPNLHWKLREGYRSCHAPW